SKRLGQTMNQLIDRLACGFHMSFAGSSDGLCPRLPSEDEVTNCFIIDDLLANRAHHPQLNSAYKV
ncbi:hypothetical protein VN97_g9709, partial [Penicillium thymicola]